MIQKIVQFLISVRLTAILLFLLIPVAILGSLIPQGQPLVKDVELYGWNGTRILYFFNLKNVFHSVWFLGLVIALGVNILACTLKSIPEMKGWEGKKLAWVALAGFLSVIFTYVGVSYLLEGLHSYT